MQSTNVLNTTNTGHKFNAKEHLEMKFAEDIRNDNERRDKEMREWQAAEAERNRQNQRALHTETLKNQKDLQAQSLRMSLMNGLIIAAFGSLMVFLS